MAKAITIQGISKAYKGKRVVDELSFEVREGEIFGLLGPNGAGKSTTLSIIQGLKEKETGKVQVLGLDQDKQMGQIKQRMGVQLQSTSLMPDLTAIEQVQLFGRLYRINISRERAMELLERFELADKAQALPETMSGGQQQRLALAIAMVNEPEIIFLDEPTTGLDAQARRNLWEFIRHLQQDGRTVVLTTHYIEEAEALADRVGIINEGKLLALDRPDQLIRHYKQSNLEEVFIHLTGRSINGKKGE